jgi:WD40 repeat protein
MEFVQLLADARFFMRDYHTPISLSALQVYYSGVVTMPECALRKKTVNLPMPRLISERDHGWQAEMSILYGHIGDVYSVAFSSDGSRIVSGSKDHTVRVWDAVSGTIKHILEGHTESVSSVAFSSDSLWIVSGSWDKTLRIWNAVSGTNQHTLEGHTHIVTSVAFSSDSLRIVSSSLDCTVRIWDPNTDASQHVLEGYSTEQSLSAFLAASTLRNGWCILSWQICHC